MHVPLCVLHKLIILSKFVTEKEKQEEKEHLHHSKIIVFVVLLSFCVILTRVRMTQRESEYVNDKSVKFQLMHHDYTSYLLTTHLDYPNYTCAFGGVNRSAWGIPSSRISKVVLLSTGLAHNSAVATRGRID